MKYQKLNKQRILILFFLAVILQTACGQRKNYIGKQVTPQQYNNISKEIKTFAYNPTYQLRFTALNCSYEIYVNDMLASFSFTTGNTAGEQNIDIPQYILSSGQQEIKVKIFPKAIEDGKLEAKLSAEADFRARIVHGEYGVSKLDSFQQVATLSASIKEGSLNTETIMTFDAQVPYTLSGWENGIDLRKENKPALLKEAEEIYKQIAEAYKSKDIATIASSIYNREKEIAQAFFFVSGKADSYDNGWEKLEKEAGKLQSIKLANDYELRYFANGKVVALLQRAGENRDYPALEGETEDKYVYYGLYLYRPMPEAPLEIIR